MAEIDFIMSFSGLSGWRGYFETQVWVTVMTNRKRIPMASKVAPHAEALTNGEPAFFSHQIDEARRFFLRLDAPWPEGFNVVCGGSEHCSSQFRIARDDFPYVSVEY